MVSLSIRTFKDLLIGDCAIVGKRVAVKVARLDFLRLIPPKFEN